MYVCMYVDRHGGVTVETTSLPRTVRDFTQELRDSLGQWIQNKASAVWLRLQLPKYASVRMIILCEGLLTCLDDNGVGSFVPRCMTSTLTLTLT